MPAAHPGSHDHDGEMTFQQIGNELGISMQAAATHYYNAMEKMREYVNRGPERRRRILGLLAAKRDIAAGKNVPLSDVARKVNCPTCGRVNWITCPTCSNCLRCCGCEEVEEDAA
jgi:hypothetical protein